MKVLRLALFIIAAGIICWNMLPGGSTPAQGTAAPEFEAADQDGAKLKLSDFKGKVTVLDFWAGWCAPCVALIPENKRLIAKYEGKGLAWIGINADAPNDAQAVLKKLGVDYRNVLDGGKDGPLAKAYGVDGWPTVLVLDRQGVVRYKTVGVDAAELEKAIQAELTR